jgi:hypothetical protein
VINKVAVLHQLANQGIHLLQTEWGLRVALQIAADKAVFLHSHLQRSGAGFIDRGCAVLLGQGENAQDAAYADFPLLAMHGLAERTDVSAGAARTPQQLRSAQRGALGVIFGLDAIPAAFLAHVFAQQFVLVNSPPYPSRNDLESDYHLFAPRVGFAYQLHSQTVLRAGYGINFLPQGVSNVGPWESPINTAMTNVPFGGTLSNPLLGQPLLQPIGLNHGAFSTFIGQSIQSRIPNQPFPYVQQWNLNVQQGFGNGSLFQIAYLGSRGEHIPLGVPTLETGDVGADLNQLSPQYYSLGAALLTPTASGQTLGQTLRPYPLYQQVSVDSDFAGDTYYNSLQATVQLRFSSGSMVLANYSWSKLISNTEGINTFLEPYTVGAIQDYTNLRAERSLDTFNVPQRFVLSYVLDLPVGRGKRYLPNATGTAEKLVSGWKLAGITTFASGFPLAITSAAPNFLSSLFGAGTIRPNVVAGCNKSVAGSIVTSAQTGTSVLNPACFAAPGPFALGNEPRVDPTLQAQSINNWDISLSKLTPMTERVSLNFGAEFFNAFNRVQFGPPNTSFGSALFGKITSQVNNPRQIQFSLRASF